jgi:adenylate cyclase
MRITPRAALCLSTFRASGTVDDAGFEVLRELCTSAGDSLSLASGMAGMRTMLILHNRFRDAARVASECSILLESIGDQTPTLSLFAAAGNAKFQAGEVTEGLRLVQRAIELADGDPARDTTIVGSPLAVAYGFSGVNRLALGMSGWREDLDRATTIAKSVDLTSHVAGDHVQIRRRH